MIKFKEFLKLKESSINFTSKYATDSFWEDIWNDLLNYFSGDFKKAEKAIESSIALDGEEKAKNKLVKLVSGLKGIGVSQKTNPKQ